MNTLENAFARLREESQTHEPPTDLHTRCLETIPLPPRRRSFWAIPTLLPRLALAAAVVIGLFFLSTMPRSVRKNTFDKNTGKIIGRMEMTAASTALAQSQEVMSHISFWHEKGRMRNMEEGTTGFVISAESKPIPARIGEWEEYEQWLDVSQGYTTVAGDRVQLIYIPSGIEYVRHKESSNGELGLDIFNQGSDGWLSICNLQIRSITDPFAMAYVQKEEERTKTPLTMTSGIWQGKSVRVFTLQQEFKSPVNSFHLRRVLYADVETGRFVAYQMFETWKKHPEFGEVLTYETQYDYDTKPNSAHFQIEMLRKDIPQERIRYMRYDESLKCVLESNKEKVLGSDTK